MTSATAAAAIRTELTERMAEVMVLREDAVEPMLVALVAGGHVLIEGIPGTGKTLLARTVARIVGLDFKRIQFTNDLMPADIVGSSIWRPDTGRFDFVEGPLFANLVLADEVNRTSPRTLSCLLEAMENGRVSVEGEPRELAHPFFVLATRNPVEFHGTYPVPEAVLDRFLARVTVGYPEAAQEVGLYLGEDPEQSLRKLEPVLDRAQLLELMDAVDGVKVSEQIAAYAYDVVTATRQDESVALGASPRAALSWIRAARSRALLDGRDYVLPDDMVALAVPVLAHRVHLKGGGDAHALLRAILESAPVVL